jgi:hypothetical protein
MFHQLYKAQRALERHLNAPLADERIRYLSHWAAQGSTRVPFELERRIC